MLEVSDDFAVPLLLILNGLPNKTGKSRDILRQLEQSYRGEIAPNQYLEHQSGLKHWEYTLYRCQENLKHNGLINAPEINVWQLTDKGHLWLLEHSEAIRISGERPKSNRKIEKSSPHPSKNEIAIQPSSEVDFLTDLQQNLTGNLESIIGSVFFEFIQRSNYLQIRLAGFSGCHYEIILRRAKHEIALHFESSAERSQARLRSFEPYIESISQTLKMPVNAGAFQTRGWTQVCIEARPKPLTVSLVKEYVYLVERFVAATFPILKNVYAGEKTAHTTTASMDKFPSGHPMYAILDQEVTNIRLYLEGRSTLPISDEKLCDWVNFCYIFGLYEESSMLFSLISPNEVNNWYYERTKKIAKICEMRNSTR